MNLKKKLVLLFAGLVLNGCMTIGGHIDLSYVPVRKEDDYYFHEIRTEIDTHVKFPIKKTELVVGGTSTTYMKIFPSDDILEVSGGLFLPKLQDYLFYTKFGVEIPRGNLEFYLSHNCKHPINREYLYITQTESGEVYAMDSEGETRIGAKLEW